MSDLRTLYRHRQLITALTARDLKARYRGSILVLPDWAAAWPLTTIDQLDLASLEPVLAAEPRVEVLLIGCGPAMALIDPALRAAVRARGVTLEPMDTGAACRTYNVLMAEDRRVAAALIAVD